VICLFSFVFALIRFVVICGVVFYHSFLIAVPVVTFFFSAYFTGSLAGCGFSESNVAVMVLTGGNHVCFLCAFCSSTR